MRSIRVGGCTHSWVVETFFESKKKRRSSLRKEAICSLGHAFQGSKLACKSRQGYNIYCRPYSITSGTEIEERCSTFRRPYCMDFDSPYCCFTCTEIKNISVGIF
jgi:hypothetical protein